MAEHILVIGATGPTGRHVVDGLTKRDVSVRAMTRDAGGIATETNHSGGIQGGISNAMPIELAMAFKPTATVFKEQRTVNAAGEATTIKPRGRHDPCVLPRAEQETAVDTAFTVSATH